MAPTQMTIVTQVAPYLSGPAGVHGVLTQATTALSEIGSMAGLDPAGFADVRELPVERLAGGGVLALFTIGETPFSAEQRAAIVTGWHEGRLDILGVHASTDACHGWDDYGTIIGARFDGHPWTQDFQVEVVDRDHPATAHLGATLAWHDELYLFRDLRPDAHVLLRLGDTDLDMSVPEARTPSCGFPLAWCHSSGGPDAGNGGGRTLYTALGHFPLAWETPTYLRHLAGGLDWLLA
jgi:uncharacterized protein